MLPAMLGIKWEKFRPFWLNKFCPDIAKAKTQAKYLVNLCFSLVIVKFLKFLVIRWKFYYKKLNFKMFPHSLQSFNYKIFPKILHIYQKLYFLYILVTDLIFIFNVVFFVLWNLQNYINNLVFHI